MWAKWRQKSRIIFCNAVEKVLIPKMRGPPPRTPPHKGEGKRQAFRPNNAGRSAHTLPPVGRVGRASGRGGGRAMLIVGAVAKALTPQMRGPPPRTPPHEGEGKRRAFHVYNSDH